MQPDLNSIAAFVSTLVRRERVLIMVRVAVRLGLVLLLALLGAAIASGLHVQRSTAGAALVLWLGIGGWLALAKPIVQGWKAAGDKQRQARLVEAIEPELRGRLVTAMDQLRSGPSGASELMVGLLARRAQALIEPIRPAAVHPGGRSLVALVLTGFLWICASPSALWFGGGPSGFVDYWTRGTAAGAVAAALGSDAAEDLAHVGDLTIRYTFPAYTGMPPKTVPNSTGDVTAPAGTIVEVSARSASEVEAAALEAYDEKLEAKLSEDRRTVIATFTVRPDPGEYRVVVYEGGEPQRSRAFAIEPLADLPPEVTTDAPPTLELALDERLSFQWVAHDDFGVTSVGLTIDSKERRKLSQPDVRKAEISGRLETTPRSLGLAPGDSVLMRVIAADGDTIAGSKVGESAPIELMVLGARGVSARTAQRQAELMKLMIPILARYLTEPWPAGDTSGELASWGEVVAERYRPLSAATESLWEGMSPEVQDRRVVERVLNSGTDLIRYTQVSYLPNSSAVPSNESFQVTAGLRDEAIVAVEEAILFFHRAQHLRALGEVVSQSEDVMAAAEQLEEMLKRDDVSAGEMLAKLDMLERMMEKMAEAAAKLQDGGLKEFVNMRKNEMSNLMDEIRKAIAEGDMEEAKELMERLAEQLESMSQGVKDDLERRQQEGNDQAERGEELLDELKQLEQEQRELQEKVREEREKNDAQQAEEMDKIWAEILRLAREHRTNGEAHVQAMAAAGRSFNELERNRMAVSEARLLEVAAELKDLRRARQSVSIGMGRWISARQAYEAELRRGDVKGPGSASIDERIRELGEIRKLLEQMSESEQQSSSQQQNQELEDQQRDLDNRLEQARQKAEQLGKEMSVTPEGMQQAMENAKQQSQQAGEDLGKGQSMSAEGAQGSAAESLKEAGESLEQAMQEAKRQQQQMSGKGGKGGEGQEDGKEGGEDGDDGNGEDHRSRVEIPTREEFQTPEEYRRALLEGMEGEVPEGYEAMKKRYFEELVQQ